MEGPRLTDTSSVLVIGSSMRANRRSPVIAAWIAARATAITGFACETVDLAALGLTFDDEPGMPAKGSYVSETTKRWSERVAGAAAVVFVTPQNNWGYPAPLKNAIDHLHAEWKDKPALIVTYGGHGGGKCAAQLREVLTGLDMRLTAAMSGLSLTRDRIVADDAQIDPERDFVDQLAEIDDALRELAALCASDAVAHEPEA